jgi:hypothetical protein
MRGSCALGVMVAVLACDAGPERSARDSVVQREAGSASGTYAIQVCRGNCNRAEAGQILREGKLFLLDTLLDASSLTSGERLYLSFDDAPTSCWVMTTVVTSPDSTMWDAPVGAGRWQHDPASGEIRFQLGLDVHSHYEVVGKLRADSIVARGRLFEASGGARWLSDDRVLARRIGPADPTPCIPAARAGWAALRAKFDSTPSSRR